LVQYAYQTDILHIDWQMPKDERTYRAAFRVPEAQKERLFPYMQQTLTTLFGIEARWEGREREVYVLRRLAGHPPLPESGSEKELTESIRGKITLRRQTIGKLCDFLAPRLEAVVMDETGLGGLYDFDLPYQPGQPEVLAQALSDAGLEATKARRNVQILVVTPDRR
jgi:uncharacterized protein (TIGR03435 family)